MKKLKFIGIFFLLLGVESSFAQTGFGIKGGVNFSQLYTNTGSLGKNITQSLDTKTGWAFGLYGRVGRTIYLQPELLVSTSGGSIDVVPISTPNSTPIKLNVSYTNLDVPLMVGFQPIKLIRFMAGPVASFKIGDNQSVQDALKSYTTNFDYTSKSAVWGYQVGVGLHLLGMDIDLRKTGSLSDVSALNLPASTSTQRLGGWQLAVGFRII